MQQIKDCDSKIISLEDKISEYQKLQNRNEQKNEQIALSYNSELLNLKQKVEILNKILNEKSNEILQLHAELSIKSDTINHILLENKELQDTSSKANHQVSINILIILVPHFVKSVNSLLYSINSLLLVLDVSKKNFFYIVCVF